jgi:hypothetical protein
MCVLRAYGTEFEPDLFLAGTKLPSAFVFRRGEPRVPELPEGPKNEMSGIHFAVSEAPWTSLVGQVEDAERYLSTHKSALEKLRSFAGVERLCLDFPLDLRISDRTWMQSDTFPASLARLSGELGIDLEFSIYSREDE